MPLSNVTGAVWRVMEPSVTRGALGSREIILPVLPAIRLPIAGASLAETVQIVVLADQMRFSGCLNLP